VPSQTCHQSHCARYHQGPCNSPCSVTEDRSCWSAAACPTGDPAPCRTPGNLAMLGLLLVRSPTTASCCGLGLRIMPLGDGLLPLLLLGLPDSKPPWRGVTVHIRQITKQQGITVLNTRHRTLCSCCCVVHRPLVRQVAPLLRQNAVTVTGCHSHDGHGSKTAALSLHIWLCISVLYSSRPCSKFAVHCVPLADLCACQRDWVSHQVLSDDCSALNLQAASHSVRRVSLMAWHNNKPVQGIQKCSSHATTSTKHSTAVIAPG
jgi:hypothetical protein